MKKQVAISIAAIFLFLLLIGCSLTKSKTIQTPDIYGFGSEPRGNNSWPGILDCTKFNSSSPGKVWNGIQIGVTTFETVVETLNPEYIYWRFENGHLTFLEKRDRQAETTWNRFNACFHENVLTAIGLFPIGLYAEEFPLSIADFFNRYGEPDYITWGDRPESRTLFYIDDGMIVIAHQYSDGDVSSFGDVYQVYLVPPDIIKYPRWSSLARSIHKPEGTKGPRDLWNLDFYDFPFPSNYDLTND